LENKKAVLTLDLIGSKEHIDFIACFYCSHFYEKEAFLMDEERASMLPMVAAGEIPQISTDCAISVVKISEMTKKRTLSLAVTSGC